jgi:hypothetical protein
MNKLPLSLALCAALFAGLAQATPPAAPQSTAATAQLPNKGKVISTIDATQYTYIEVQQDKKVLWLAAPTVALKKDTVIRFEDGAEMTNFHSKTLNRTFPSVRFVSGIVVTKEKG